MQVSSIQLPILPTLVLSRPLCFVSWRAIPIAPDALHEQTGVKHELNVNDLVVRNAEVLRDG
jgi:hypothetical protein